MAVTRAGARHGQRLFRAELPGRRRHWRKYYRPSDTAHRHRLPDRQPKTVQVDTYIRRS